jgi:capsular exopolysaccharide synthesis family protein
MEKVNLITYMNPKSPASEAYRILRTNIQFASPDKELKTILITSSTPDEGKSTTVVNLGIILAQAGKKILVIDCDLRKPVIHKSFRLSNDSGLTNILVSNIESCNVINKTYIDNLEILTSGPIPPNPAELLGSKKMKNLLQELTRIYDYIILDTPPIGLVTDSALLAAVADGTILVISSGKVVVEMAKRSTDSLLKVGANILGVVLNKIPKNGKGYYNSYYYKYYDKDLKSNNSPKKVR